jgi:hypothetical protein
MENFILPTSKKYENAFINKQLLNEEMVFSVHYFLEVTPTGEIIEELATYGKADLEEQIRLVREILKLPLIPEKIICPRCKKEINPSSWLGMSGNPLSQHYYLCRDCGDKPNDFTAFFSTKTEIHYMQRVGNSGQSEWKIIKK